MIVIDKKKEYNQSTTKIEKEKENLTSKTKNS
jgi:hypothetical protein